MIKHFYKMALRGFRNRKLHTTINLLGLVVYFGLIEADHRFGERVVVRVTSTNHGRFDADLYQPLGVENR